MTSTPSPEDFLAQPYDPDEDNEPEVPAELLQGPTSAEAMQIQWATPPRDISQIAESIADSLRNIAGQADNRKVYTAELSSAITKLSDTQNRLQELEEQIGEVLIIIKPSQSKLAKQIQEVLNPPTPEPARELVSEEQVEIDQAAPADDASVEEWRQFARTMAGDANDWSELNRSQIRTALGIAQPVGSEVPEVTA
jgi:hypothetical protein